MTPDIFLSYNRVDQAVEGLLRRISSSPKAARMRRVVRVFADAFEREGQDPSAADG
jgi:hypothetical protein